MTNMIKWWNSKSRKWKIRTGIGTLAVLVTLAATLWILRPIHVPDFNKAPTDALALFLATDDFARLSTAERNRLMKILAARYLHMTFAAQHDFNAAMRNAHVSDHFRHQLWDTAGVAIARRLADTYQNLSPLEREAFLDNTFRLFQHTELKKEGDKWFSGQSILKSFSQSQGSVKEAIVNFQTLVNGSTSPTERANINAITSGLTQRWKQAQTAQK